MANFAFGAGGAANLTPISQNFSNVTELTINHGKSYIPSVWIIDGNGNQIAASITFGQGSLTFYSMVQISGTIYIR